MAIKEYRVDVYDRDGASRLGTFDPAVLSKLEVTREENGVYTLDLECPVDSAAFAVVPRRGQVWLTPIGSANAAKFRVLRKGKKRDKQRGIVATLECGHLTSDLTRSIISSPATYGKRTVSTLISAVLSGSGFTVGTVDSNPGSIVVEQFDLAGARLDLLQKLREAADAVLIVNDDLSVDLLERKDLTGGPEAVLHPDKNLISEDLVEDESLLASRMLGLGGGDPKLTLKGAWHEMYAIGYIVDDYAFGAYNLGHSADCYLGISGRTYFVEFASQVQSGGPTGTLWQIKDFIPHGTGYRDEIRVYDPGHSLGTDLVAGDRFRIWWTDGANFYLLDAVEDREAYDSFGWAEGQVEGSDLEPVENLFLGGFLSGSLLTYPSGRCSVIKDIATYGAATYAKNTDTTYIWNGEASQKVTTGAYLQGCYADFQLDGWADPFDLASDVYADKSPAYFSVKLLIYLKSGQVQVDVSAGDRANASDGNRGTLFPNGEKAIFAQVGWHEITMEGITKVGDLGRVWIYQAQGDSNTAEFYVDSIQVEPTAAASSVWTENGTATDLWARCYVELGRRREPKRSLAVEIRDRSEEDPTRNPYDVFETSDRVRVISSDLGLDEVFWCSRYTRDKLQPGKTSLNLKSWSETLADQQSGLITDMERLRQRTAQIVGKIRRDRLTPSRTTRVISTDPIGSRPPAIVTFDSSAGPGRDLFPFRGFAAHGVPFLRQLTVPAGRKVMVIFFPSQTFALSAQQRVNGWPYYATDDGEMMELTPTAFPDLRNRSAVSFRDYNDNPIRYMKWFVTELSEYRTDPTSLDRDRSSAWDTWIPPGTYKDLMLFAWGEPPDGGTPVLYGGTLILMEAPLFRGVLASNYAAGSIAFEIAVYPKTSAAGLGGEHIPMTGKFQIGEGATAEIVEVGDMSGETTAYKPSRRRLKVGTFQYAHKTGEPVIEVQVGT